MIFWMKITSVQVSNYINLSFIYFFQIIYLIFGCQNIWDKLLFVLDDLKHKEKIDQTDLIKKNVLK